MFQTLCIALGALAAEQAKAAGLCLATGIGMGVFALLFLRRSSVAERILCDLAACVALGGGAALCCELFLGGKPELYGIAAFLAGASVLPSVAVALKKRKAKRDKQRQNKSK